MKTPIQEAIETIKEYRNGGCPDVDTCNTILLHLASMLEKEEEVIMDAHMDGQCDDTDGTPFEKAERYYNETFKTEE